ncbi:MAG: polysaccharide deacetylase [Betaproteobacteria bacterium]|nr:polysaccharide deacetylase [Betaproteobacteria bacterium]
MIEQPFPWPEGKRCAVCLSFDIDGESLVHLGYREEADNKLMTRSEAIYDAEIATPRVLAVFRNHGIRQTFFVPAWCVEHYPGLAGRILSDGHEIGHHGYLHENPNKLSAADERDWFRRAVQALERATGRKPAGFRAPSYAFSRHSLELMLEAGMVYDASLMGHDIPYLLRHPAGDMIELPSQRALDDWTHFVTSRDYNWMLPISPPAHAFELYRAEFDAAWRHGGLWVAVWHPFVTGRLSRCEAMDELIDHMRRQGGVWFATLEEIALHARRMLQAGRWNPYVQTLPHPPGLDPALAGRPAGG